MDTNSLTDRLEHFNEDLLILRGQTCENLEPWNNLHHIAGTELSEYRAFHDNPSSGIYPTLQCNRPSSEDVISSAHLNSDASFVALGYSFTNTITEGVFDTSNSDQRKIFCEVVVRNL